MKKKITKRKKTWFIIIGSLLVLLLAVRIALPYILLKEVNKELNSIPGYKGHVDDIDVALYRGAYIIKGVDLEKTGGKIPVPFFSAVAIDLSLEWRSLFHGRIVGKIIAEHPILNFVNGPTEETSQTGINNDWTKVVSNLMPLKINRFEINNGEIHYRDFYSNPKVDLLTQNVHILAVNLSNANRNKDILPSTVTATADVYGGHANLTMKMNALNTEPTFEAKAEMVDLDITDVNNFLQAYGGFDVKQGTLIIYTEAAAKDGMITGYTKPIIKDLKVVNWEKDKSHPLKIAWEAFVGSVAWILKNHRKDQLATKAEFEGNIKDPNVNVWFIVGQVLRNAFIQALYPSLENSVNFNSIKPDDKKNTVLKKEYDKSKQLK